MTSEFVYRGCVQSLGDDPVATTGGVLIEGRPVVVLEGEAEQIWVFDPDAEQEVPSQAVTRIDQSAVAIEKLKDGEKTCHLS